jgi:uncharacterized SAM-binding protein YcdF (DUF218 family)
MKLFQLVHIFPLFLYPVGLSCLFGVAAAIAVLLKKKRLAAGVGFSGVGVLWIFSTPFVCWALTRLLECQFDPNPVLPKSPAIVLLGGCTKPAVPPRSTVELNCAGDRIIHAARLLKQGYAPVIISSGGKLPDIYDFPGSEGKCMATILRDDCGVDSSAVIVEDEAEDTHDHAPKIEAILRERGLAKDVILVTSASHMLRSVLVFRKKGFIVHPSPADFGADENYQWNIYAFLPRGEALFGATIALHEYYGLIAYKILGWI